jgi:hypothetical protein
MYLLFLHLWCPKKNEQYLVASRRFSSSQSLCRTGNKREILYEFKECDDYIINGMFRRRLHPHSIDKLAFISSASLISVFRAHYFECTIHESVRFHDHSFPPPLQEEEA